MPANSDPSLTVPRPTRLPGGRSVAPQTLTTMVSAGLVLVLGALLTLTPVPFVAWSPGRTVDVLGTTDAGAAVITIENVPTFPVTGQLRMTTIEVTRADASLFLPQALAYYWLPYRDVLPRDTVYPPNKSSDEIQAENVQMMDTSKRDAVAAALRAAGLKVTEYPQVVGIVQGAPADGTLALGDFIVEINGVAVTKPEDIATRVSAASPGDSMSLMVIRDTQMMTVQLTLANDDGKARIGIRSQPGFFYPATVSYGLDPAVVGPSAGLIFSLAIYDMVTEPDLLSGAVVAGTGTIAPDGKVGPIGGIQEKIKAAEESGATTFLVPAANCGDLDGVQTSMSLVKVDTLKNAISALQLMRQDPNAEVPRC